MPDTIFSLPFTESYWVIENRLAAGEYPGQRRGLDGLTRIRRLLDCRLTACIDLTHPEESETYQDLLVDEARSRGLAAEYYSFPISDISIAPIPEMQVILDCLDDLLARGKPTYVHCRAGIGRTGTVVGCFLVRHGQTGPQALESIRILRKDVPSWWYPSPESGRQKDMVLNWQIGK